MCTRHVCFAFVAAWLGGICATAWCEEFVPPGGPRRELRPPPNLGVLTHVPSRAGGERGLSVRVLPPAKPRYEAGAPVVIHVAGGVEAGAAVGRPEFAGLGFVEIFFGFPGGRDEDEAASGGKYDFRGPNCTRALADVIRFATGRAVDKQGRKVDDLVGNVKILRANYGLLGPSHGGNACGLAMARHGEEFPDLAWYASMESPYGEGMVPAELGGFESGVNPAYDPTTGVLDIGRLAWSDELPPAGFPRRGPRPPSGLKGALYFDINRDGKFSPEDDFPANVFLRDVGSGMKAWYSPRLLREAERRSLFGNTRPAHIPTVAEAEEFWRERDASAGIPEAVRKCPNVAVIVYAGERDHVQVALDHPHILAQVEGFRQAKARFVRLNPDRAYVERILQAGPMLPAAAGRTLADNDASRAWDRGNIREGLEPGGPPIGLYMQAAVCELADRTQAGNWAANLGVVLYPQAPMEPMVLPPAGLARAEGPQPAQRPPGGGPWERDLLIAASEDGTTFAAAETFVEGGGVPSVIKDAKGRLVAAFQWFPARDSPHFDRVAVKISEDGGKTWSAPQPIMVEGLPETYQRPFDPTLALAADGRIRLYFSCSPTGQRLLDAGVGTYSAVSTDGVRYKFEPGVRFSVPGRPVIDCAVVRLGEKWHYTAPRGRPDEGAYHAVSDDGLKFTRVEDIPSVDGANWLGNLMPYGDGMRFYGGAPRGTWWAFSKDGREWTRPTYLGIGGGDPAAVQVSDKRFLIIYTSEPRRRGLPPGAGPRPPGTGAAPAGPIPDARAAPPRGDSPPREGPYTHAVCSASSQDGLTWTRDPGTRIEHASVPCAVADGDKRILLYYVDADRGPGRPESVGCAVSEDGLSFTRQPFAIEGLPADKALDPCVLKDEAGAYRLYYFASSMAGDPARDPRAHRVRLAVSADGVRFKDADLAFARPGLVDPDVFQFKGQWFMYVFGGGATIIATSPDGRRFTYRQDLDLPNWGTTAPVLLGDGRLRLYAFEQRKRVGNVVRSFISTDGLKWEVEDGTRLTAGQEEQITDPFVVRWKGGYRMFFKTQKPPRPPPPGFGRPAPLR